MQYPCLDGQQRAFTPHAEGICFGDIPIGAIFVFDGFTESKLYLKLSNEEYKNAQYFDYRTTRLCRFGLDYTGFKGGFPLRMDHGIPMP